MEFFGEKKAMACLDGWGMPWYNEHEERVLPIDGCPAYELIKIIVSVYQTGDDYFFWRGMTECNCNGLFDCL